MNNATLKYSVPTLALAALTLLSGCAPSEKAGAQAADGPRRVAVSVTPVRERDFEERITAQGTLVAKNYAMVAPRVDGVVTDMFVEEGDRVEANKTRLFQIDKVVLKQAHEVAVQDKAVAEWGRIDAEAQVVAAQAQHDKAKLDYERFGRLIEQQAITVDAMEQMEAGYAVAKAQLDRAKTAVRLREEQEKQAAAALAIAAKRLEDSLILSPIDGWVSFRGKKPGEFAGAGTPIVRVADTSVLEVSAFLPSEFYPRVRTGETLVRVTVSGIDLGRLPVTYKSPEIQDQLRTFEIKCLVESPPEGVAPGAIAQIEAVLETRTSLAVPHDIIQIRDGKTVVFVAEQGRAKAVEVRAGLTMAGWTELLSDTLTAGTPVITLGYNLVNEGAPVDIHEEETE